MTRWYLSAACVSLSDLVTITPAQIFQLLDDHRDIPLSRFSRNLQCRYIWWKQIQTWRNVHRNFCKTNSRETARAETPASSFPQCTHPTHVFQDLRPLLLDRMLIRLVYSSIFRQNNGNWPADQPLCRRAWKLLYIELLNYVSGNNSPSVHKNPLKLQQVTMQNALLRLWRLMKFALKMRAFLCMHLSLLNFNFFTGLLIMKMRHSTTSIA